MIQKAAERKNTTQFVFAENSLDILRLFAALQIAITHYLNLTMLTYGKNGPGDGLLLGLKRALTLFPGLIILFTISGFLMGETIVRTKDRKTFAKKRVLRLYPALWVNIVLTIGLLSLLPGIVLGHGKELLTWAVVQGVGLAYTPSFLQEFATGSINGTLWALMVEIQLYVLIAFVWKRCLAWKDRTWHVLLVLTALLNLICGFGKDSGLFPGAAVSLLDRSFLPYLVWFFAGLYLWHFKETILKKLAEKWYVLLVMFICYKACWQTFGWKLPGYYADIVTSLLLPAVVLACAYGWKEHRLKNDLSYGIFLYHWPLINLVFYWNFPEKLHHIPLFFLYTAGFLALACASWFLLERRVLKRKQMKIVMLGADRSVKGGVSAVVNNLYEAGLDRCVDLTYIGTMVDGSAAAKLLKGFQALVRFLIALPGTDIVHLNMAADASCYRKLIFMQIALWFHKKIVIHEHGGDFQGFYYERCSEKRRSYIKKMLNRADLFLVLTNVWKDFFSDIVERDKIHVLQNAVPVPKTPKTDYSSHTAVFLGRLCPEKGVGELLDCVETVQKQIPDFHLIMGGFWENGTEELQKKAKELEAQGIIECPGWVSAKQRSELFEKSSIFVLPTWFEGQPVSLLEAMAAGMCSLTTAVGGIPQTLGQTKWESLPTGKDGCGVMVEAKNSQMLEKTLAELLADENLRRTIGTKARARVQESYAIDNYVNQLVHYYEQLRKEV